MEGKVCFKVDVRDITEKHSYSDSVTIDKKKWFIQVHHEDTRRTNWIKHLCMYAHCKDLINDESWNYDTSLEFRLINQQDAAKTFIKPALPFTFSPSVDEWGINEFMKWDDFIEPSNGFVVDNHAIFELHINLSKFDEKLRKLPHFLIHGSHLTDCTLTYPGGDTSRANSKILGEKSIYFAERLKKSQKVEVVADMEEMFLFLELLHNCGRPFTAKTVPILLKLAKQFDCAVEIQQCEKYILESTEIPIADKLHYADEYLLPRLKAHCFNHLKSDGSVQAIKDSDVYGKLSDAVKSELVENLKTPETTEEEFVIHGAERNFRGKRGWLTDCVLDVNGEEFHVSKEILSLESDELQGLVLYARGTATIDKIRNIKDFDIFLQMIYQPTNLVTTDNIVGLMHLADRFKVKFIMHKCEQFLIKNNKIDIIDKLVYASDYEMKELTDAFKEQIHNMDELKALAATEKFSKITDKVLAGVVRPLLLK